MRAMYSNTRRLFFIVSILLYAMPVLGSAASPVSLANRRINAIVISGNTHIPTPAIKDSIPLRQGELLVDDADITVINVIRTAIKTIYFKFKRIRNITFSWEPIGTDGINLYVTIEEKTPLKNVKFEGNSNLTEKEIAKKVNFAEIPAIDSEELAKFERIIKKLYEEKGYHQATIEIVTTSDTDGRLDVVFKINEGSRSIVKQILFKGNNAISSKKLRGVLFTKEDWLLSFLDHAGTYQPERIDGDKYMIEQIYQNSGYLHAKVVDTQIDADANNNITITHEIKEGDKYTIGTVEIVAENDRISREFLQAVIPVQPGSVYSREKISESIKTIEAVWGDFGYLYAQAEPSVQPNDDTKQVDIGFYVETGKPVTLNKLTIRGNKKTRDKVIRRNIALDEGEMITNSRMEASKHRVEGLGYFDQREGVNWKTTRLSEDTADLDLVVKEIKTGSAHVKMTFGGAGLQSPSTGVALEGTVADRNILGSGVMGNVTTRIGNDEKTIAFNVTQPWMFDTPLYTALDGYHKRVSYDELRFVAAPVNEKHTGAIFTGGFIWGGNNPSFSDIFIRFNVDVEDIRYAQTPRAAIVNLGISPEDQTLAQESYDHLLTKYFDPGAFVAFNAHMGQDRKNHPMHPFKGHTWIARNQVAIAAMNSNIGFYKFDFEANWYNALIGMNDLVFRLHGYLGIAVPFNTRYTIPYRELYHIGGPASVRGFIYGQIGPQFVVTNPRNRTSFGDSIGGGKAFFLNAELLFPITPDFNMKGVFFYDGGAGWDNPYAGQIPQQFIRNNRLDYRHAVGFGVRVLNPMPLRVDWGFKLDPRKGEPAYKVDFGMSYDW